MRCCYHCFLSHVWCESRMNHLRSWFTDLMHFDIFWCVFPQTFISCCFQPEKKGLLLVMDEFHVKFIMISHELDFGFGLELFKNQPWPWYVTSSFWSQGPLLRALEVKELKYLRWVITEASPQNPWRHPIGKWSGNGGSSTYMLVWRGHIYVYVYIYIYYIYI